LAIGGLALAEEGPLTGLAPVGDLGTSLLVGVGGGLGASLILWLLRKLPALEVLQRFQRRLVQDWTVIDALAVALLSGLAEEALLRAVLQPVIGLFPAAVLFAALHLVPDRRLWMWPLIALTTGIGFGLLFEGFGYPAAATAHIIINALALLRLREPGSEVGE
jgi:hypothetical protein